MYFYCSNLKETSAQLLGFNIEMIRYLPLLLKYSTAPLADNEWDFIMCSMLAWLEVIWKTLLLIIALRLLIGSSWCPLNLLDWCRGGGFKKVGYGITQFLWPYWAVWLTFHTKSLKAVCLKVHLSVYKVVSWVSQWYSKTL